MKQVILQNWNFIRVLRLLLGLGVAVQAIALKDPVLGAIGILFSAMAVFNWGCCGTTACYTPRQSMTKPERETSFETVD